MSNVETGNKDIHYRTVSTFLAPKNPETICKLSREKLGWKRLTRKRLRANQFETLPSTLRAFELSKISLFQFPPPGQSRTQTPQFAFYFF